MKTIPWLSGFSNHHETQPSTTATVEESDSSTMMSSLLARRSGIVVARRCFSDATAAIKPKNHSIRRSNVTPEERAALRNARKERGLRMQEQRTGEAAEGSVEQAAASSSATGSSKPMVNIGSSPWIWYAGVLIPSALLVWGFKDPDSPPAKLCNAIGLTGFVSGFTEDFAKPSHAKLLPDWAQVRNIDFCGFVGCQLLTFSQFQKFKFSLTIYFVLCRPASFNSVLISMANALLSLSIFRCQMCPMIFPFLIR